MLNELISFLITGVTQTINIQYFLLVLLSTELIKGLTFYSPKSKRHIFKIDKNARFPFKSKVLAVVLGIISAFFIYAFSVPFGTFNGDLIKELVITFALTTSFYELFFFIVIDKFKEILKKLGKAEIKPIIIDTSGGSYEPNEDTFYDYNRINQSTKESLLEDEED